MRCIEAGVVLTTRASVPLAHSRRERLQTAELQAFGRAERAPQRDAADPSAAKTPRSDSV